MCITKKATKKGADGKTGEKKHVLWKKKSSTPSKEEPGKTVPSEALVQVKSQLEQEKPTNEKADPPPEKSEDKRNEEEEGKVDKKPGRPAENEGVAVGRNMKKPSCESRTTQNSRSMSRPGGANQKKKGNKFRVGQVDRDELSITNDNTEFLENAQLTKLMSHADLKALMNGQLAQGGDVEGGEGCYETIEEVDSEMQDLVFSPLLAAIPKEEHRGFNTLPNPNEA